MAAVADLDELIEHYRTAPVGVRANMIFSADGAAAFAGRAGPLSDPLDQALLRALRGFADVVLVGAGTVRAEHYGPVRVDAMPQGRPPHQPIPPIAVVSLSGVLPDSLFADPAQRPILVTTQRAADERGLRPDRRRDVVIAGEHTVDASDVLVEFRSRGLSRVLCEGGPTLLDELVTADVVDEICVTVSPTLAGVQDVGRGAGALASPRSMRLDHALTHADYLYLKYSRRR
ncbi:pyrimidine reductase family protein [Mycobacterium sp. IS-1496]|uniref:pyrimidine reductase family protein n=1 Tax=Mycobacterium sp. IS-1496 TaxID=1772284 RepID=UPI00257022FF|nr:pyrimidine reductase family protein [Mycobacterium sp. IS-1496]